MKVSSFFVDVTNRFLITLLNVVFFPCDGLLRRLQVADANKAKHRKDFEKMQLFYMFL